MKAIAKESPDRRGRSNLRAYLPIATKQRLVAAAELNGLTLTGLIVAVGENAHRILPLLRLDSGDAMPQNAKSGAGLVLADTSAALP
jgi:hypothetical protein